MWRSSKRCLSHIPSKTGQILFHNRHFWTERYLTPSLSGDPQTRSTTSILAGRATSTKLWARVTTLQVSTPSRAAHSKWVCETKIDQTSTEMTMADQANSSGRFAAQMTLSRATNSTLRKAWDSRRAFRRRYLGNWRRKLIAATEIVTAPTTKKKRKSRSLLRAIDCSKRVLRLAETYSAPKTTPGSSSEKPAWRAFLSFSSQRTTFSLLSAPNPTRDSKIERSCYWLARDWKQLEIAKYELSACVRARTNF